MADWDGTRRMVEQAVDTFGDLHVLVNNAGILRDRMLVNMSEQDWDSVMHVHLKGHFCPTRHAAAYWRGKAKEGKEVNAALVHTSSASGVLGNVGQTNYGVAKAGIAAFSNICALELGRYGVRSNAITPNARTRLTTNLRDRYAEPAADAVEWDRYHPGNVSPVVAMLSTAHCTITNEIFHVSDEVVARYQPHVILGDIRAGGRRWTVEIAGNTATGLSNLTNQGVLADGTALICAATYHDSFGRFDGRWLITERVIQTHHFAPLPGVDWSPPEWASPSP